MSDENLDHHEQHDHAEVGHDHHEAAGDAWHGHEPPIDDFSDPMSEATASEESDSIEDIAVPVEMTRRSPVAIVAAAIVGGVLLIGAVAYWQFGSMLRGTPQTPRPISMTQNAAPKPLSAELTKDNGIIQNGTAQPTPPAAEPQPPMVPPVAEAPAPAPVTAQAVAQEPAPVNPASIPVTNAQPVSTAPAPAAQPVVAQPVVPAPVPSTTAVVAPAAVPAPAPVTAPATAKNAATDDARVAELTARVDELQKSLAQATQQLSQMGNKVATPAASGDVNDRIAHLEQEIIQLQQAPATVKARPIVQAAAEAPVVTSHKKHHSKTPGTTSHHKTTQKSTREANTSGRWVLRAASPDEAWVSKTADSHDLRPVHVGDTVPGIGRVQSIDQVGDNWVVRGTAGAIH